MNDEQIWEVVCEEREKFANDYRTQWFRGESRFFFNLLLLHERTCEKCRAIKRGTGLAGGLFRGAFLVQERT